MTILSLILIILLKNIISAHWINQKKIAIRKKINLFNQNINILFLKVTALSIFYLIMNILLQQSWQGKLIFLFLSIFIGLFIFNHQRQKNIIKKYLEHAQKNNIQTCFMYATKMNPKININQENTEQLGEEMSLSIIYMHYIYLFVPFLYFIIDPALSLFYLFCILISQEYQKKQLKLPQYIYTLKTYLHFPTIRIYLFLCMLLGHVKYPLLQFLQSLLQPIHPDTFLHKYITLCDDNLICHQNSLIDPVLKAQDTLTRINYLSLLSITLMMIL